MATKGFKGIKINVDLKSIRMMTLYELYDWGYNTCLAKPAFLLPRNCSNDELMTYVKNCYDNSGTISNDEYENSLGGFTACKKALKIRSLDAFYRANVGLGLRWEEKDPGFLKRSREVNVRITVWRYIMGERGHDQTDDVFYLKYVEECLDDFVIELRKIMDDMYEKYRLWNVPPYKGAL